MKRQCTVSNLGKKGSTRKDLLTTPTHEPHDTIGKKKTTTKHKGKRERQIERKTSKTASRPDVVWDTDCGRDKGSGPSSSESDVAPSCHPLLVLGFRPVFALRKTISDMLACLCVHDFGCLGRDWIPSRTRPRRLREMWLGDLGMGKKVRAERPDFEELSDVVLFTCPPSQLYACLLCLALPCLALPYPAMVCSALFLFSLFFINSPGGRMEG